MNGNDGRDPKQGISPFEISLKYMNGIALKIGILQISYHEQSKANGMELVDKDNVLEEKFQKITP